MAVIQMRSSKYVKRIMRHIGIILLYTKSTWLLLQEIRITERFQPKKTITVGDVHTKESSG